MNIKEKNLFKLSLKLKKLCNSAETAKSNKGRPDIINNCDTRLTCWRGKMVITITKDLKLIHFCEYTRSASSDRANLNYLFLHDNFTIIPVTMRCSSLC